MTFKYYARGPYAYRIPDEPGNILLVRFNDKPVNITLEAEANDGRKLEDWMVLEPGASISNLPHSVNKTIPLVNDEITAEQFKGILNQALDNLNIGIYL